MAQVSAIDLVKAWQTSESVKEVEAKTGLQYGNMMTRIHKLKKLGVPLKQMAHAGGGGRKLDIEALKALCLVEC